MLILHKQVASKLLFWYKLNILLNRENQYYAIIVYSRCAFKVIVEYFIIAAWL